MLKLIFISVCLLYFFSEAEAVLKSRACPTLTLKFGRVRSRQKGRLVKFICNTGYIIAGERYSTCHNGEWDSPLPKCVRASCTKANPPIHGLIYPSHRGAVLNFFCKPGFELHGPNATYCDGRNWDTSLPSCIPSNTRPLLSCNFESEDLCGWNQDIRHDFEWTRMNFKTPSGHLGTGPSFDHTKGEGKDGYYMYIESSSRNENDTARLISPIYEQMNQSDVCLEFFYHMHGSSTGQLRVYVKKISESWDLDPKKALFWRSGNHGDKWLRSFHQIGLIEEDFQIVIEGVRGASYFSDIAVDDVRIIQNCALEDEVTTESDVTYTEDDLFQSCVNRCDSDNYIIPPEDVSLIKCACDDTCTDNNTCCPDYIAVCVLGVTDDMTATEPYSTTPESTTIAVQKETTILTSKPTPAPTKSKPIPSFTTPRIKYPYKNKTQTSNINSNDINSVLPKYPKANNTNTTPPNKYNVINVTTSNIPHTTVTPIRKLPTLVFLTPSTAPVIVQKIGTTTTKPIKITLPKQVTNKIVLPKTSGVTTKTTPAMIDEILTVPNIQNEDKTYFPFVITTLKIQDSSSAPIREFPPHDIKVLSTNSKAMQAMVKEEPQSNTKLVIIVVVASISFVLFSVLSGIFIVRRYKRYGCRNGRMNGSSSDSQSDVRFLTSDEILDFNLAYPDD